MIIKIDKRERSFFAYLWEIHFVDKNFYEKFFECGLLTNSYEVFNYAIGLSKTNNLLHKNQHLCGSCTVIICSAITDYMFVKHSASDNTFGLIEHYWSYPVTLLSWRFRTTQRKIIGENVTSLRFSNWSLRSSFSFFREAWLEWLWIMLAGGCCSSYSPHA